MDGKSKLKWQKIARRLYASGLFLVRYEHSGRPLSLRHNGQDHGVWVIEHNGQRIGMQPSLRDAKEQATNHGR